MNSRYLTIDKYKNEDGKEIYNQIYFPEIGLFEDDTYIITQYDNRYDLISYDFWNDESYWWVIPMINNLECDSIYPPIGIQLRISKDINNIISLYNRENG